MYYNLHSVIVLPLVHRLVQWDRPRRWSAQFPRSVREVRLQTDYWLPESQFSHQTTPSSLQSSGAARLDDNAHVSHLW